MALYNRHAPRNDLSANYVRRILDYDPATGRFVWKSRGDIPAHLNRRFSGTSAGSPDDKGRIQIKICKANYYASRLAWLIMTGDWPERDIDHRNRNLFDNSWNNLRQATHAQNMQNRQVRRDSTSGLKGIKQAPSGRWRVRISTAIGRIFLGTFDTKEEAAIAYKNAAAEHHGEFART